MPLFLHLVIKLIPLYFYIVLGYIAGKKLGAHRETIATIMLYMISPLIIFNGVFYTPMSGSVLLLPFLTFIIASFLCLSFYKIGGNLWEDASKNIMAFSAGSGGTGYFGVPLAMMILNPQTEGIYIMSLLGVSLYENSLGYFISAKGLYTPKESLYKLLKLPTIYAFFGALLLNLLHFPMPEIFQDFMGHIKGVYIVLGMMIIGLGLSGLTDFKLDYKFVGMTFFAKFLVWPFLVFLLIQIDTYFFNIYDSNAYHALTLLAIVPLAFNTVIMATEMKSNPEKTAATVLLSTLFALIYVPIMASLFIPVS